MDLARKIAAYQPNGGVRQLVADTKFVLLVGISGAGKDTTKQRLLQDPEFADIVSYTTRPPRQNAGVMETPGVDYHFIDEAMAVKMLENHEFIEAKFVHGTVYGTSAKEIQAIAEAGKIAVTDIDVQGVSEYKKLSGDVAGEMVDALSVMCHRSEAPGLGREIVKKLKEVVPRQSFEVSLQAAIGARFIARENIGAYRKDVTGYLYGGDVSRKKKLLAKQARGKKRMKRFGKVDIPSEAFMVMLKRD